MNFILMLNLLAFSVSMDEGLDFFFEYRSCYKTKIKFRFLRLKDQQILETRKFVHHELLHYRGSTIHVPNK